MKKIQVCIIDDEGLARARVRRMLLAYKDFEIIGEFAGGRSLIPEIQKLCPDLIFLDVQMPQLDGFQLLEELGKTALPYVIFITAYDQYAVRAFEVNSLDYLLKPFDEKRFSEAIRRVKETIHQKRTASERESILAALQELRFRYKQRFAIKDQRIVRFKDVDHIDWIEAKDKYIILHQGKESHVIRAALVSIENDLDPKKFMRVHRSSIVNLSRVKEMQPLFYGAYRLILSDNTALRVGRSYLARLRRALLKG